MIEGELCPALGVAAPPLTRARYDLERFLSEVASAWTGVQAVRLVKRRRVFEVAGARAERTRVELGKVTIESVAVEAEIFEAALAAVGELGLARAPNLDYIAALRRRLAGLALGADLNPAD